MDWAPRVLADLESTSLVEELRARPTPDVPGWLWTRVRGDLRTQRGRLHSLRRLRRRWGASAAAAVVLLTAGLVYRSSTGAERNSSDIHVVFQKVDRPLLEGFSPPTLLRGD